MKAFFKRLLYIGLIPIGIIVFCNALGLWLIYKYYPYPENGMAVYLRANKKHRGSKLLIGCSNLKHNIEPDSLWKKHPEVDIFHFPAVTNSTFMRYIGSLPPFNEYDTIIYYAPYTYYKKSIAVRDGAKADWSNTCGTYAIQTIEDNPINFFNNWLIRFYNIKKLRKQGSQSVVFYTDHDTSMMKIKKMKSYINGDYDFIHYKHAIEPIEFNEKDKEALARLFPNKVLYLFFPPIPNIEENNAFIQACANSARIFPKRLNVPFVEDSTLFFDQWFHLNGIGNKIETNRLMQHLDTLNRCP